MNLAATPLPMVGFLGVLNEKVGLPKFIEPILERYLEAAIAAILILPEDRLRQAVLTLLPDQEACEGRAATAAQVEMLFQKAKGLSLSDLSYFQEIGSHEE